MFSNSNVIHQRAIAPFALWLALFLGQPGLALAASDNLAYDWSGVYVGFQVGHGSGDATTNEMLDGEVNDGPLEYRTKGALGGIHIGYNGQSGRFVYGVEGDIEHAGIDGHWDWGNGNGLSKEIDWVGSLRGRIGVTADRLMVYGTAGLAVARVEMAVIDDDAVALSKAEAAVGLTAGLGAQYALTDRMSVRMEYRYTDFGETSVAGDVYGGTFSYPHDNKIHALRIGASIKF